MELPLPDWVNNEFFTKCLRHIEDKQTIVVTSCTASFAAPAGNNYGSLVLRVKIEFKEHENDAHLRSKSLIVKTDHIDGAMKGKFVSDYKETTFYYNFVPRIRKFIKTDFLAESFYSPVSDVIVLEDLKERKFIMADKQKQLDFDHCRLYLHTAATLHAASVAVHREDPDFMEITMGKEKIFEGSGAAFMKSNFKIGVKAFIEALEQIEEFKTHCRILKDIAPFLWDMIVEAHKPSDFVNTINQGDPWTTNMMFKYDNNGRVSEVKLLDFQLPRLGSPVNDVMFFLWSSGNHDVRQNSLNELFRLYLDEFNNKLQQLNCPERLSYEQFMENVKRLSPLAMFAVASMMPFYFGGDPEDIKDFAEIEKGNENVRNPFEKCYTKEYCETHLPKLLYQLEAAGIIDYFSKCKQG